MKTRDMTFSEKAKMWYERHRRTKNPMLGIGYEFKHIGPMDPNWAGFPKLYREKALGILLSAFLIVWYAGTRGMVELDPTMLAVMTPLALYLALPTLIILMLWTFIYLHEGTFTNYKRIINAIVRYLDSRDAVFTEWRVIGEWELYVPEHARDSE
ncbi:MAG: hypothetical protein ACTSYX_04820 [Candidatus Thorarchaeota archaeon]